MNTPRILITAATGKTGTPAIKELRQQGIAVRAMAHKMDERAAALTELGAEVVVAKSIFPTCTHWGNYRIEASNDEITAVLPYDSDNHPTPIGQSLLNALDSNSYGFW